jgi:hypothetical protein
MRNYEVRAFLKYRVFSKYSIPHPWRNFRISKKFKLHERMWNSSIIVNKLTYILGAHVKPPKLAKPETFSKKLIFPKFRENETISKNWKFHASWLGNVTYYDKQFIIMRNYEFRTFLKNRVFHKNANTPRRNFRISKKFKLHETTWNLSIIVN